MKTIALVSWIILLGCAANPRTLESVAKTESARMAPPAKRFVGYANYELKRMVLSPAVQYEAGKVKVAGELENTLRAKLKPLFDQWKTAASIGRSGTLVVEPQLAFLKVVSGGARFWGGAFAGDSSIDMDLVITDQTTRQQVAKARITRNADSMTGMWSIGQSDENLLEYIASIAYQYLKDNY